MIAQALALGLDLPQYVAHVLREKVVPRPSSATAAANAWRECARGLPNTPPLYDYAISRESIYGDRGR